MNGVMIGFLMALVSAEPAARSAVFPVPEASVQTVFGERQGTLVVIDCGTQGMSVFRPEASRKRQPPCSTFKIWNTLIGAEAGLLTSAGQSFYKWDGEARFIPEWNRDLTLREAFGVSCVPAFQDLARRIGPKTMRSWIERIGYGDGDISAGVDVFWLPAAGRKTILISPVEQARLMCGLVSGSLPFSGKAQAVLKSVMEVKKMERGELFGKTGSGMDAAGTSNLGWFVGYVETGGRVYAFACVIMGDGASGKAARGFVETIFGRNGYL